MISKERLMMMMNLTLPENNTMNNSIWSQIFPSKSFYSSRKSNVRVLSPRKHFTDLQLIELCSLCWILVEHTIIFLLTFRKKSAKKTIFHTNEQQPQRSIVFPSKSFLYHCLHRNWIRAYSFSNISLSFVYFLTFYFQHYYPNLVHYTSITFYSLPLTLVQQILTNFNTFHLFIISISILQYFIRSYRLLTNKYSINIYSGRNLLITKHTNVALILSGSLALIFGYNYIFYTPKYSQTMILLPLLTLNAILLPLIDFIIFIFILVCFYLNHWKSKPLLNIDASSDNQSQQCLTDNLRSTIEKTRCIKCYSKFLQLNRNILQETDPYTKLHSRFFSHTLISSTRPSITTSEEIRKYSTMSYESIPSYNEQQTRLRASYPCSSARTILSNKPNRSQQDFLIEQRQNSTNELFLQTTLMKLKEKGSLCHLCYYLLLFFLLKYVLLTFPQHSVQMCVFSRQFVQYIRQENLLLNPPLTWNTEPYQSIFRLLFLLARFGDCFLLTRIPDLMQTYLPCWCQFNSKLFRKEEFVQRVSNQILMRNTDSLTNEPFSTDELTCSMELANQPDFAQRRQSTGKRISRIKNRRFRLRFQFVPIWSKKRRNPFREPY